MRATASGLHDRGLIRPGLAADLTVFDPETVAPGDLDQVADYPGEAVRMRRMCAGVDYTIVNGEVLIERGEHTGAYPGQVIGMGAGQQSRSHCTRIACSKAEKWMLQTHPDVLALRFPDNMGRPEKTNVVDQFLLWDQLSDPERQQLVEALGYEPRPLSPVERASWFEGFDGLVMSSDAFIPFRDNIDRAAQSGVKHVAHAGGSIRDESVRAAAAEHAVTVIETGVRCFLH